MFIIGPTGKRFRSRNELKSFFEKTNEKNLNPDDFDFSTFGRNNPIKVRTYFNFFTILLCNGHKCCKFSAAKAALGMQMSVSQSVSNAYLFVRFTSIFYNSKSDRIKMIHF